MELEHVVAWLQRHLGQLVGSPGGYDDTARVGVVGQRLHRLGNLVNFTAILGLPVAPLHAVDGTEVSVLQCELVVVDDALLVLLHARIPLRRVGRGHLLADGLEVALVRPLAPDAVVVNQERADVAVASKKPQQFARDEPERHPLGGDQRKTFPQIVADRDTGDAPGASAGTVALVDAVFEHVAKSFLVRDHVRHNSPKEQGASD